MNIPLPSRTPQTPGRNWPRRLANTAVAVLVIAVAAAVFVLSYSGVRAIAVQGGVSTQLARVYPGVFDAVLFIACVSAILLRDGRWWARAWAWFAVVVLLAAIGATDMLHAMSYTLRHRPTEGIVAAAPVVAVLLAFSLLLTLLRQSGKRQSGAAPLHTGPLNTGPLHTGPLHTGPLHMGPLHTGPLNQVPMSAGLAAAAPDIAAGAVPREPAPPIALPPADAVTLELPPAGGALPGPELAATREDPVLGAAPLPTLPRAPETPETPDGPEAPEAPEAAETSETPEGAHAAHAATEASEVIEPETAPPTVPPGSIPAIRYASSALASDDYWDADDDRQFAGQVYPDPRAEEETGDPGYTEDGEPVPPFAAAPATQAGRFNRVRSTPTPPVDDEE